MKAKLMSPDGQRAQLKQTTLHYIIHTEWKDVPRSEEICTGLFFSTYFYKI